MNIWKTLLTLEEKAISKMLIPRNLVDFLFPLFRLDRWLILASKILILTKNVTAYFFFFFFLWYKEFRLVLLLILLCFHHVEFGHVCIAPFSRNYYYKFDLQVTKILLLVLSCLLTRVDSNKKLIAALVFISLCSETCQYGHYLHIFRY